MSRNSVGTYTLPQSPFTPNTTILSASVNSDLSDIASALTGSIASNGVTPITGQLKFPAGTPTAPSHTFAADLTTGMYLPGVNYLGFACAGSLAFLINYNKVGTGQDGNILSYGNGALPNPTGAIIDFAGAGIPSGWLLCYGQAISRTAYPELFTVISTNFGSGDGSTTFNVPDLRGRVTAGKDDMGGSAASRLTASYFGTSAAVLGANGGVESITLSSSQIPALTPTGTVSISDPSHNHAAVTTGPAGVDFGSGGANTLAGGTKLASSTYGTTISSSFTGITASFTGNSLGGGGLAHNNVQPTMIFNKIIFAGRP